MKVKYISPADQVVNAMTRLYNKGMTTISGGNISVRDENGDTWVSPTRLDKGHLTHDDIVLVKPNGDCIGKYKPSIEYRFHVGLLDSNPDIKAVIHAHCPNATIFGAMNRFPDINLWHDCKSVFENQFGRVAFSIPGSDELKDAVVGQGKLGKTVVFMNHHGILVGGKDIYDAWYKIEMLERLCAIDLLAHQLGNTKSITGSLNSYETSIKVQPAIEAYPTDEIEKRRELCTYVQRSYSDGFIAAMNGSFSAKVSDNSFLITPKLCDFKEVSTDQLVLIKDGVAYGGEPDEDWKIHEEIYRKNVGYESIFFLMPTYSMAWAASEKNLNFTVYMGMKNFQKNVRVPYTASMEDILKNIDETNGTVIVDNRVYIIARSDIKRCFSELETLEDFAMAELRVGDSEKLIPIQMSDKVNE